VPPGRGTAFAAGRLVWPTSAARRTYQSADLKTLATAPLEFPEEVDLVLSPRGTRALAIGRDSGALYQARFTPSANRWSVERLEFRTVLR